MLDWNKMSPPAVTAVYCNLLQACTFQSWNGHVGPACPLHILPWYRVAWPACHYTWELCKVKTDNLFSFMTVTKMCRWCVSYIPCEFHKVSKGCYKKAAQNWKMSVCAVLKAATTGTLQLLGWDQGKYCFTSVSLMLGLINTGVILYTASFFYIENSGGFPIQFSNPIFLTWVKKYGAEMEKLSYH